MTDHKRRGRRRSEDLVRAEHMALTLHGHISTRGESLLIDARTRAAIKRDPRLAELDSGVACSLLKALAANREYTKRILELARSENLAQLGVRSQRELFNLLGLGTSDDVIDALF